MILEDVFVFPESSVEIVETPPLPGRLLLEELEELEELWPFDELVEGVLLPELFPVLLALLPPLEGIGSGIGSETDTPEFDWLDGGGETQPATKPAIPTPNTYFKRLLVDPIKQAIE